MEELFKKVIIKSEADLPEGTTRSIPTILANVQKRGQMIRIVWIWVFLLNTDGQTSDLRLT
jgi:hypothetical protein